MKLKSNLVLNIKNMNIDKEHEQQSCYIKRERRLNLKKVIPLKHLL